MQVNQRPSHHCRNLSAFVVICLLGGAVHAQFPAKDAVREATDDFDRQVQVAKKQFDQSVQRAIDAAARRLSAAADAAIKAKNEELAGRALKELLRLDRSNAKAREYFEKQRKLDQLLTQFTIEWRPLVVVPESEKESAIFYECLLGRYKTDTTWIPAVTLAVPDGTNTFNEFIRQRVAAGVSDPSQAKLAYYESTGSILVPSDGIYRVFGPARMIKLNGKVLPEVRETPIEVPLKKGRYSILVNADAQYTSAVSITIVDPRTDMRIPIFNSLADIKKFLQTPHEADGPAKFDVSRWSPERAAPLKIALPPDSAGK